MIGGAPADGAKSGSVAEVFLAFLGLGLTSFGGPVAHLGYFRNSLVARRRWLSEEEYAELVALCQFLPGPASSQVGMGIGYRRAGHAGAIAAWLGFTLPSALALVIFAYGATRFGDLAGSGALAGLKIAALAVVAQAVLAMGRRLTPDRPRQLIAALAAIAALLIPTSYIQPLVIAVAAAWGAARPAAMTAVPEGPPDETPGRYRPVALVLLVLFFVLLVGLPPLGEVTGNAAIDLFGRFYRIGALVFGGGHVVLPLMQGALVGPGLIRPDLFLAGYGAAQAVPGPLFSFAAYAGAVLTVPPNGLVGATIGLVGIYLPSFLLVLGALPYWGLLRRVRRLRAALETANAAVVGLLAAALYDPVFTSAVAGPADFAFAIAAFTALAGLKTPPWLLVVGCAVVGLVLR